MAANQTVLNTLHEALAELFLEDIRICKEESIPMSASDKAVIVKFLKDNNITAEIDMDSMQTLQDEFKDELAAKRAARANKILEQEDSGDELQGIL